MKIFKRTSLFISLSCLFLVTGCAEEITQSEQSAELSANHSLHEKEHGADIASLEDLISSAHNIVVGNVISEEEIDDFGTYKYTVSVKDDLIGNVESKSINVHDVFGTLEIDKEYILFLESWESELYPHRVFTNINKYSIIEVDKNTLKGGEGLVTSKSSEDTINLIKKAPKVKAKTLNNDIVVEKATDLEELISLSENIIRIVPKIISDENKYVKRVDVSVLETFKGTIKEETKTLSLPSDIELDKEYIVFLQDNVSYSLATREGSVVSKENEALWKEIINKFAK